MVLVAKFAFYVAISEMIFPYIYVSQCYYLLELQLLTKLKNVIAKEVVFVLFRSLLAEGSCQLC